MASASRNPVRRSAHNLPPQSPRRTTTRHTLDLLVARGTALGAPGTGIATGIIGLTTGHDALLIIAVTAAVASVLAVWQLTRSTPDAILLNLISAIGVGTSMVFLPIEVAAGVGVGIVVFTLTGLPVVEGRSAVAYVAVHVAALLAAPIVTLASGDPIPLNIVAVYALQGGVLGYGAFVLVGLKREIRAREARYQKLFSGAPVALWENDFSAAGLWLDGLRASGITDLRAHLKNNPDELTHGIGLVTTRSTNQAAADLVGSAGPDAILGSFPPELVDAEARALFLEQFVGLFEGLDGGEHEFTGTTFEADTFRGILSWSNPKTSGGELVSMVTAVSDVSSLRAAQKELEASRSKNQALIEALPDLVFLCDADGTYLECHATAASDLTPSAFNPLDPYASPCELVGKRPTEIFPAELAQQMEIAIATALETSRVQAFEYELPVEDESRSWEMRVSPLEGKSQVLTLIRDITQATEVRRELERLIRSKDDFIAAISHEIRTPLTGIVGFARLLNGEAGDLDEGERRGMIESLEGQSVDLTNIVEDLLVAAKADLGRLQVASVPTNLRAQAAQVLEGWDRKDIGEISVTGDAPTCVADPGRVRQVIRNLITNAIRYGGDRIEVRIDEGVSVGSVTVVDNGHGLPPEEAERAFEPYQRAARRDGLTAALGIGLPISRNLARLMSGDLVYNRIEGETQFTLTLPLADREPTKEQSPPSSKGMMGHSALR